LATPPRLTEIECPCGKVFWTIDHDYRGMDGVYVAYSDRRYVCDDCGYEGPGWTLLRQSPSEFLLQPHNMYPMRKKDFDYWVDILKSHFPDHPCVRRLGVTFAPRLPEEELNQSLEDERLRGFASTLGKLVKKIQSLVKRGNDEGGRSIK
jgi:hypothetical protein